MGLRNCFREGWTSYYRATILVVILGIVISGPILLGGVRGAGKYNGVVFYDRWDNCYLFSGVYLMYVSKTVKNVLRPYNGQSMEIDAKEVYQPMNPGDGLIEKLTVIGRSKDNAKSPLVQGIKLRSAVSNLKGILRATVEIQSLDDSPVLISSHALGFAVIGFGRPGFNCPSDGTSCAVITRVSATDFGMEQTFTMRSGETRTVSMPLDLPVGSYQFLAGYGGGVHAGPSVASNAVSFEVGAK